MTQPRRLFTTSLARSGGSFFSYILSAHPDVQAALCPLLEFFRSFRNALVRNSDDASSGASFDPAGPLDDYHFLPERIRILDAVQAGNLDIPFDQAEWPRFREVAPLRTALECPDLAPGVAELSGLTYREILDGFLTMMARTRGVQGRRWVGLHEVWIIEFFPHLARAYPEAKFVVQLRDPRAIVNSVLGGAPDQAAHVLSYARHWRKYVSFVSHLRADPVFRGRLHVQTYERLVREPEATVRDLCTFLEISFEPAMLDTERFYDHGAKAFWQGNSSFEATTRGFAPLRTDRWRTTLNAGAQAVVDFACGPELRLMGYEPADPAAAAAVAPVLTALVQHDRGYNKWRTDNGDPALDFAYERLRRDLLDIEGDVPDPAITRRCFLFEEAFRALKTAAV